MRRRSSPCVGAVSAAQVVKGDRGHAAVRSCSERSRMAGAGGIIRVPRGGLAAGNLGEHVAEGRVQPVEGVDANPGRDAGKRLAGAIDFGASPPTCSSSG